MEKCSINTCTNKRYGKRISECRKHHELNRIARGELLTMCSFRDCPMPARSHKLCPKHYRDLHPNRKPENEKKIIHTGAKDLPEYINWCQMKSRCLSKTNRNYKNYGGRGIKISERWLGKYGFINFYDDMGKRPTPKHSINRINNDGDYTPENCEWSTVHQQNVNRRSNTAHPGVSIMDGRKKKWVAVLSINYKVVYRKYFYTKEEAIIARRNAEVKYLGYNSTSYK